MELKINKVEITAGQRKENLLKRAKRTAKVEIKSLPKRIEKENKKGEYYIRIVYFSTNQTNADVFRIISEWAKEQGYTTAITWGMQSEEDGYHDDILTISWS